MPLPDAHMTEKQRGPRVKGKDPGNRLLPPQVGILASYQLCKLSELLTPFTP